MESIYKFNPLGNIDEKIDTRIGTAISSFKEKRDRHGHNFVIGYANDKWCSVSTMKRRPAKDF